MEMKKFAFGEVIVPMPEAFRLAQVALKGREASETPFAREFPMIVHPHPSVTMSQSTENPGTGPVPSGSISYVPSPEAG